MKIVHLALCGPVMDGWNYQDNMLVKFHRKKGFNVCLITSKWVWGKDNKLEFFDKTNYYDESGAKIIRLDTKHNKTVLDKSRRFIGLYDTLLQESPDILFIHQAMMLDVSVVVKYLKAHTSVKVFVDNHNDFSNTARNPLSKYILHGIIWRHQYKKLEKYAEKFFGVLPARVDFLHDIYGIPKEKIEYLPLGADDDLIDAIDEKIIQDIRLRYKVESNTFLIVTGGKIDEFKLQILSLMQAVSEINSSKIKLLVFGSVSDNLIERVENLSNGNTVQYVGWINAAESYKYFAAADLVVFPGRHSVFWEQVVAQGKPLVCKEWVGTTHVDIGGNCIFLHEDTIEEIKSVILSLISVEGIPTERYTSMLRMAQGDQKEMFKYGTICQKCL